MDVTQPTIIHPQMSISDHTRTDLTDVTLQLNQFQRIDICG